jgi:hypothetical protein
MPHLPLLFHAAPVHARGRGKDFFREILGKKREWRQIFARVGSFGS